MTPLEDMRKERDALREALRAFVRNETPHPEWKPERPLHGICGGPTEADLARALALLEAA